MALQRGGEGIMVFKDVITVYNVIPQRGREPQRIQHTVVSGVFWDSTCGAAFGKRGKTEQDSVVIIIPDSPALPPAVPGSCG